MMNQTKRYLIKVFQTIMLLTIERDIDNLPPIAHLPTTMPLLLDDSDSDDEEERRPADLPVGEQTNQYGNDCCIENDPIPIGSDRQLQQHRPVPPQ